MSHELSAKDDIASPDGVVQQSEAETGSAALASASVDPLGEDQTPKKRSPAAIVGGAILLVLLSSLAWSVASDLNAPSAKSGAVAAYTAQIAPRVSGQVAELYVADNQVVKKGEPLFLLDPEPFDLVVAQAEAALAQAALGQASSSASLIAAQAQVDQAEANLANVEAQLVRARSLFERGIVTKADLDTDEAWLASATATRDAAIAQLNKARLMAGDDVGSTPQIAAAQAQLAQAQLNRKFALVTAPVDGVITNLRLAHGQFMAAGSSALTLIEAEAPWIVVDMRENQLAHIDVGDEARVLFDAVPGQTFEARVKGIAWGIDLGRSNANGLPVNQQSTRWFEPARTIPVQVELVDPSDWPANVRVGSKVTALVYANGRGGLVSTVESWRQTIRSYLSYLY